ncbi:MAG: riboflavin synthase, partial [Synergistaceae bacterium]|nr:riboflavin synthase [Synergistaceae bacterium]
SLIPATLESTALGCLGNGDEVNVETDILGKYVRRFLEGGASFPSKGTTGSLTRDAMREAGWI